MKREIALSVDGYTAHFQVPRAVDLPVRGTLDVGEVAHGVTPDAPRALPVAVEPPAPRKAGVTIGGTAALITDPGFGKYPHKDGFRDELLRSLDLACELWGADTLWADVDESYFTKLLRHRCEGLVAKGFKAVRATEITVSRLVCAVRWLRKKKRELAREAYRQAAYAAHPDRGGSTEDFQLVQEAKRVLEAHFGASL